MKIGSFFGPLWICLLFLTSNIAAQGASIGLGDYVFPSGPPIVVTGTSDNLSGLTFNRETGTIFAIVNSPTVILELNPNGTLIRTISLPAGTEDTEGIVHLGGSKFGIVEERRRNFLIADLSTVPMFSTIPLNVSFSPTVQNNDGLEGIAYDELTGTVYVTKELNAPTIYSFSLSAAESFVPTAQTPRFNALNNVTGSASSLLDLAGLHFDPVSGNFLVLSEASKTLIEMSPSGDEISRISLAGMLQPEGVTMGPNGDIYIVSEPNKFYVLQKPQIDVPEPSGILLIGAACFAFVAGRRKRITHSH